MSEPTPRPWYTVGRWVKGPNHHTIGFYEIQGYRGRGNFAKDCANAGYAARSANAYPALVAALVDVRSKASILRVHGMKLTTATTQTLLAIEKVAGVVLRDTREEPLAPETEGK